MKKRILSIILSAVFLICMCTTQIIASADVSSNYSSVSTLECQKYPIKNSTIVTFGDSITAFAGWQDEIEALGATVVNSGVGGRSVLASMQEFGSCVLQYNPDFATIMFGFNDGNKGKSTGNGTEAVSKEKFKAYYKEFVRLCRENDIIPIIITQHTCVEDIWYSDSRYPDTESFYEEAGGVAAWFDSYAQIARDVANELDVNLIDWNAYSKTLDETDIINSDGVHLSSNGQNALGALVSDYFSTNFSGDAAETEKPVYPKQNTVLIEDFNDSTDVPENFSSNGKADSTLTVTDEISTGNNALKNEGAEWSGPRFSFNSMPENCIGLRFKMYTSAPTYSVWAFNSTSAYDTANRVYDERYITNYVYDAFVSYNFYFDDYTVDTGSISDIVSFTIIPVSGKTAYFDDFEWIVEGTNTNPATTTTKATETSLQSTTVTTTTTTTTTASNSTEDSGVINLTTGTVYDKLTTAISAATSGDTLKLLSDLSVDATSSGISISKSLVIDLGGNTLTSTNKRLFNITASSNAELTIKNGNLVIDSSSSDIPIAVRATNDLVLEDLTVTGSSTPNYGFVTVLSPSTTDPCNITAKNCNINTSGYIFSDNNASNAAWNLYIYNSELSVSSGSIILKKDTAKTYDAIIYSGHIKNGSLNTAHYPNLKIADGSYMTATEGGSKDTATTSFTTEYWVYV
ncbi:MAG: SGNH/GDSL hydrolase family protein, partial [Acutalibacteraceae bacterium]